MPWKERTHPLCGGFTAKHCGALLAPATVLLVRLRASWHHWHGWERRKSSVTNAQDSGSGVDPLRYYSRLNILGCCNERVLWCSRGFRPAQRRRTRVPSPAIHEGLHYPTMSQAHPSAKLEQQEVAIQGQPGVRSTAPDGTDDEAVALAAGLLGGHGLVVGWGGRVRVVAPVHGTIDRWRAAITAPAYRLSARVLRNLLAARVALTARARVEAEPIDLTPSLPTDLRRLRPASVIIGTPGMRRSLVVRLIDQHCIPRAAMKIAVASSASEGIRREAEALRDPVLAGRAPELLHMGEAAGRQTMITAHVSGQALRYGPQGTRAAVHFWSSADLSTPNAWATDHPWIISAAGSAGVDLDSLASALPRRLALTRTHGDFAPWNLLQAKRAHAIAIDWESSTADGLPASDLAHFVMASERLLRGSASNDAAAKAASTLVERFGYDRREAWTIVGLTASATAHRERTTGGRDDTARIWEESALHALSQGI